jgi:hypothetical protein
MKMMGRFVGKKWTERVNLGLMICYTLCSKLRGGYRLSGSDALHEKQLRRSRTILFWGGLVDL